MKCVLMQVCLIPSEYLLMDTVYCTRVPHDVFLFSHSRHHPFIHFIHSSIHLSLNVSFTLHFLSHPPDYSFSQHDGHISFAMPPLEPRHTPASDLVPLVPHAPLLSRLLGRPTVYFLDPNRAIAASPDSSSVAVNAAAAGAVEQTEKAATLVTSTAVSPEAASTKVTAASTATASTSSNSTTPPVSTAGSVSAYRTPPELATLIDELEGH